MSARRLRASLRWILCAGAVLVLVSANGCGTHRVAPPIQAATDISLDDALAELAALEAPEGVDEALFEELKGALEKALLYKVGTITGGAGVPPVIQVVRRRDACATKLISAPPTGNENRVTDLAILDNEDGTFTLSWHYRNLGDYDQNGTVGIADITPIAIHYGEEVPLDDDNCIQAVVDGSFNVKVEIADITPIAMNFGVDVADYGVEGAVGAEGEFSEIGAVEIGDATGKDTGRAVFEYALTPGENGYFRVLPRDSDGTAGDASNVVGLALEVLSVAPLEVKEGTVVTFTAEVTGAGPFEYAWDFGGQAVPATSEEAEPEVVLTREVGEFSASLTVTNPQDDVTYPFTLTKLSREWKFETILSNVDIATLWPQMKVHGDKLWIHACEDTLSPPPNANYVISGLPGNWEIEEVAFDGMLDLDSEGRPGVAYRGGVLLDEVLSLAELRDGNWQITELLGARVFPRVNFVYAADDEPFITFSLPDAPNAAWIEYFWRRDGEWERGIVDEPYSQNRPAYCMTTDPEGNPVLCYNAYKYNEFNECRIAWWKEETYQWEFLIAEDYNVWYSAIDFNRDGRLCVTYSDNYKVEPDAYCDRLIYAVYDGEIWEKEVVDERIDAPGQSYDRKSLNHDPLGNPIIVYRYDTGYVYKRDLVVEWFNGEIWETHVVDEGGNTGWVPSIAFGPSGTAYVLSGDLETKEVVLARYE